MLIFLDLETTGLEASDKICSIALLHESEYIYELLNEGKKLSVEASSVNHITKEMLVDKPAFKESMAFAFLQEHNSVENTLVAHNIKFDLEILRLSGFEWQGGVIDTLRVTKHLIPECELFSLQILRYELRLYKQESEKVVKYGIKDALYAHHALSDALVTELLYEELSEMASVDTMQTLSQKNVLLEKFNFGKHKGKHIEEVIFNDRSYVEWLLNSATELDEDMRYSLNYYL
jgi:DNA polymerase-3 subunit epsilon/exodeoxyribonuclease X